MGGLVAAAGVRLLARSALPGLRALPAGDAGDRVPGLRDGGAGGGEPADGDLRRRAGARQRAPAPPRAPPTASWRDWRGWRRSACSCCSGCWPARAGCSTRCRPRWSWAAALTLVARPLSVAVCATPFGMPWRDQVVRQLGGPARSGADRAGDDPDERRAPRRGADLRRRLPARGAVHAAAGADPAVGRADHRGRRTGQRPRRRDRLRTARRPRRDAAAVLGAGGVAARGGRGARAPAAPRGGAVAAAARRAAHRPDRADRPARRRPRPGRERAGAPLGDRAAGCGG